MKSSSTHSVPEETSATKIIAVEAVDVRFTRADDYYDDNGPVIEALYNRVRERVFLKIRDELPYLFKLKRLLDARPRDPKTHRLLTPFHGCYGWDEICIKELNRDPRTIRYAFEDKDTEEEKALKKAERDHAKNIARNAAALAAHNASQAPNMEIVRDSAGNVLPTAIAAKVLAQEAELKVAKAALAMAEKKAHTARNDGFADGVSAQQAYEAKREAVANTLTETFYVILNDNKIPSAAGIHHDIYLSLATAQKKCKRKNMTVAKVDAVYTVTPCVPPVDPTPTEKSSPSQPIKVAPSSAIPVTAACDHVDLKEIEGTTPFRYICTNEECGKILHTCLGCGDVFLPSDTLGPEKVGFIHECAIGGKDCVTRLNGLQVTDAKTDYHPELVDACDEKDADVPEIVGQPARVAKPQKRKPELSALIQDLDLGHLQKLAADPTKLNIGSRSYLPRQVQAAAKLLLDEKLRQSEGQAARPLTTSKFEPQRESGSRGTQESLLPQASA